MNKGSLQVEDNQLNNILVKFNERKEENVSLSASCDNLERDITARDFDLQKCLVTDHGLETEINQLMMVKYRHI